MGRRDFLKLAVKVFITVGAILILPFIFSLMPFRYERKKVQYFFIAGLDELPRRGIKMFELNLQQLLLTPPKQDSRTSEQKLKIYIVKKTDGWIALSPVCTHLGCIVNWNRTKKEFVCPCHGGRYNIDGEVIGGPPPLPLTKLPLRIDNERVFVGLKV